jgi:hypothetical protein
LHNSLARTSAVAAPDRIVKNHSSPFQFQNRHVRMSSNEQEAVFATYPFPRQSSRIKAPVHMNEPNWSLTSQNDIQRKRWEESPSRQVVNAPTEYFLLLRYRYITLVTSIPYLSLKSPNMRNPETTHLNGSMQLPAPRHQTKANFHP